MLGTRKEWTVWLAWGVILALVVWVPVKGALGQKRRGRVDEPGLQTVMRGKSVVAMAPSLGDYNQAVMVKGFEESATTDGDQVAAAIVLAEFSSKAEAVSKLKQVPTEGGRAYLAYYTEGKAVPPEIREAYGFFADLAAVHGARKDDPRRYALYAVARQSLNVQFVVSLLMLMLGVLGIAAMITAILQRKEWGLRVTVTSPVAPRGVYVEGFAIYLGLYVGVTMGMETFMAGVPFAVRLIPVVVAVLLGATWPLLRGVPLQVWRGDLGITAGKGVLTEMGAGIGGYLAGIPVLALGLVVTLVLAKLTGYDTSHPIASAVTKRPWVVALLAVIFAPLSEEYFFRGTLLSHIRGWRGIWGSSVVAGLVTGIIFAAMHPQGWPAIPLLGSIGFVLAMIRQWRGTLLASIAAHAVNNGTVVAVMLLMG